MVWFVLVCGIAAILPWYWRRRRRIQSSLPHTYTVSSSAHQAVAVKSVPLNNKTVNRSPTTSRTRPTREYATFYENGKHRSLTSDEVAQMFTDIIERTKEHRTAAKKMRRIADKFSETGKLDIAAYDALSGSESKAAVTLAEAEMLHDKLYFNSDASYERYNKYVDYLYEAEAEIEDARTDIIDTQKDIESGDFTPQKIIKAAPTPKPPKGSSPTITMRYRNMSGNENDWEIFLMSRSGLKSFVGWSFEKDYSFNFNTVGIIWAKDIKTGAIIEDFNEYLITNVPSNRASD